MIRLVDIIFVVLLATTVVALFYFPLKNSSKPDPPPTICTLKLNDANNTTSYISGPNVNE